MLAPRKSLWKTPTEVVTKAAQVVPLRSVGDTVVDLGCGDGDVLIGWAKSFAQSYDATEVTNVKITFIGIDIEEDRISKARSKWKLVCSEDRILASSVSMTFHCANVLESQSLWSSSVTVLFLYLIPRGLRRITPLLQACPELRAIASFMNPLEDPPLEYSQERLRISVSDSTKWPLYVYQRMDDPVESPSEVSG